MHRVFVYPIAKCLRSALSLVGDQAFTAWLPVVTVTLIVVMVIWHFWNVIPFTPPAETFDEGW